MPRKKTEQEKKLAGTWRPDRARPKDSLTPLAHAPRMPRGMEAGAKAYWRKWAPMLAGVGILTELDVPALAEMCHVAHRLAQAEALITELGSVITGRDQQPVRNPAILIAAGYRHALQNYAAKFGMTPDGRAGLKVQPTDNVPSLADQLNEMVKQANQGHDNGPEGGPEPGESS